MRNNFPNHQLRFGESPMRRIEPARWWLQNYGCDLKKIRRAAERMAITHIAGLRHFSSVNRTVHLTEAAAAERAIRDEEKMEHY
jgi:hypothetical protein